MRKESYLKQKTHFQLFKNCHIESVSSQLRWQWKYFSKEKRKKKHTSISNSDDVSNPLSTIPLNPAYVDNLNLLTFPRHIWPSCGSLKPRRSRTHSSSRKSDVNTTFSWTPYLFSAKNWSFDCGKTNMLKQGAFYLSQNQTASNISNSTKGSFWISEKITSFLHS